MATKKKTKATKFKTTIIPLRHNVSLRVHRGGTLSNVFPGPAREVEGGMGIHIDLASIRKANPRTAALTINFSEDQVMTLIKKILLAL